MRNDGTGIIPGPGHIALLVGAHSGTIGKQILQDDNNDETSSILFAFVYGFQGCRCGLWNPSYA